MAGRGWKDPFLGAEADRQGRICGGILTLRSACPLAPVFMRLWLLVAVLYPLPAMSPRACCRHWICLCVVPSEDNPRHAGDPQEYVVAACAIRPATAGPSRWTPLLRWTTVLEWARGLFSRNLIQ